MNRIGGFHGRHGFGGFGPHFGGPMMRGPVFGPRFGGPMMMMGPRPFYGGYRYRRYYGNECCSIFWLKKILRVMKFSDGIYKYTLILFIFRYIIIN